MNSARPPLARPLPVLAAACFAGLLAARALGPPAGAARPFWLGLMLLAVTAGAALGLRRGGAATRLCPLVAALAAGLLLGLMRPPPGPLAWLPDHGRLVGRVRSVETRGSSGAALGLDVARLDGRPVRFGARLYVPAGAPPLLPGDVVLARATELWRPPTRANPGGTDERARLAREGVRALGVAPGVVRLSSGPEGFARRLARARRRVRAALWRRGDAPAVQGTLLALSLGASRDVPVPTRDRFARAGLAHLLAVSGLHLGLVAVLLFAGLKRLALVLPGLARRADVAAAVVGAPVVGLLVAWVGRPPSAARAGLMALVLLGATVVGRRRDGWTALGFAALGLLAVAPSLALRPGFQLSFAAVAGLLAFLPALPRAAPGAGRRRWRRALGYLGGVAAATVAASLATAPLCALYFGRVPVLGAASNLLAVPLTGLLVPAVALATTASALLGPVADPLWGPAALLARALDAVAGGASRLPLASVAVTPPGPLVLVAVGLLLVRLARPRARRGERLGLMAAVAVLLVAAPGGGGRPPPSPLAVTFLSVGHGDAILVRTRAGDLLVDAGGDPEGRRQVGRRIVVPALRALGVRRLAAVLVTHPHPDHFGGMDAVVDAFPVGAWYETGEDDDGSGRYARAVDHARRLGVPVRIACRDPLPDLSPVRIECLSPHGSFPDGTWDPLAEANDNSIVLRVSLGRVRFLLPGDIERGTEARLVATRAAKLRASVVKAPHHGSRTSSSPAFVAATGATHVVFSVAARSHFGFPAPGVLARWRAAGAVVHRTDVLGAVTFLTDGTRLSVRSVRRPPGSKPRTDLRAAGP